MNETIISALISTIVPSLITIIGFIVTYNMNVKNYKEELHNSKTTLNIEKLQSIILDVSNLMNNLNNINVENYKTLVSNILSYGSIDSIKILTYWQTSIYVFNKEEKTEQLKKEQTIFLLSIYSLLITQIKYDLTGEIIPPLSYAKIKLTDFDNLANELYIKNNEIVDNLELNQNFKSL